MNAIPRSSRSNRCLRRAALLFAAALALPVAANEAAKNDLYSPAFQKPASADRAALREQQTINPTEIAAGAGTAAERTSLRTLGFDPDDPIALQAYRAELASPPDQMFAAGDFFVDRGWGGDGRTPERYDDVSFGIYRGIKAARLDSGEVVAIGAVQVDWSFSLGITKRSAAGQRVPWTNALSAWSGADGQYLLISAITTGVGRRVAEVRDIKAKGNRFYVLANVAYASTGRILPEIFCFNADGSLCDDVPFNFANGGNVRGIAFDVSGDHLVLLTTNVANIGAAGFSTRSWTVESNGALVNPTSGYFPTPGGYERTGPVDIAFRRHTLLSNGDYYVLFNRKISADASSGDYDPCLLSLKADHTPNTNFSATGAACNWFDDSQSSKEDKAVALVVGSYMTYSNGFFLPHERVHVLVAVARKIENGFGIWALRDASNDTVFGTAGLRLFGGCGATGGGGIAGDGCQGPFQIRSHAHHPAGIAYAGSDLIVVGYDRGTMTGIGGGVTRSYTPMMARIGLADGAERQLEPVASGFGGDGQFNAVLARDSSHVLAIGESMQDGLGDNARTQIMIGLTSDDTIFKNGFDR